MKVIAKDFTIPKQYLKQYQVLLSKSQTTIFSCKRYIKTQYVVFLTELSTPLGEKIDWGQTGLDLLINTVTATIGNIVGGKMVPTNSKWFQPKHFLSVFRKSYGQKLLMQTVIGGTISGIVNFTRKYIEYGKQYTKRQPKRRSITAIN